MRKHRWRAVCILGIILSVPLGCSMQADYMRRWQPMADISHRWTGGTLREHKLSSDEAAVLEELGTPETIRFFRSIPARQRVYEWLYEEQKQIVWFVDGQRVEYIVVDTGTSAKTKTAREVLGRKVVTGGVLAGVIGGVAAGFLALSETLGLKD
ncbi:MAG: hypothetical protein V3U27_09005 [Candidatus Tectomicrobia bacterium]